MRTARTAPGWQNGKRRATRPRNPGMAFATLPVTSYSYPCSGFSCLIASTCAEKRPWLDGVSC
jgi:hypothetical protein